MIRLLTSPTIGVKPSNIMIESYYAWKIFINSSLLN
jgi:hypothetical protein